MLDPKQISEFDQSAVFLSESLPPLLWKLFENSKNEGFNDNQAMEIVLTYIKATLGYSG